MARFITRCLDILEDIYRFDDARRTVQQFELNGPIQPVHDVSREAEIGASPGYGGFFHCGVTLTHAAANTQRADFSLYDPVPGGGVSSQWEVDYKRDWVWVMDVWMSVTKTGASNFNRAAWYLYNQDLRGVGPGDTSAIQPQMLMVGTMDPTSLDSTLRAAADWAGILPANYSVDGQIGTIKPKLAFPIDPASSNVEFVSNASGAVSVSGGLLIWVGKQGILPPGMG